MFDDNIAGIHMSKTKVRVDRPTYVGMGILNLSKNFRHDWFYNHLKKVYGDRVRMLYADADSFIVYVQTDIYADIVQHADQ